MDESIAAREMTERDQRDSTRADAPLMQAPDAVYLDTTGLSIDEVVEDDPEDRRAAAPPTERKWFSR